MKYYMATFDRDWADEFSVIGSKVLTESEKVRFESDLIKYADLDVTIYFGTNEGWEDKTVFYFASSYKFTEISKTMYDEAKKNFGGEFGTFINVIEEALEQENDDY